MVMAKLPKCIQTVLEILGVNDLASVTKQMIEGKLAELEEFNPVAEAILTAAILEVKDNSLRRVKKALGMEVPELSLTPENCAYMEDDEIKNGFLAMNKIARAQFISVVNKGGVDHERVMRVLATIKNDVVATKEAEQQSIAAAEKANAARIEAERVEKLNADRAAEEKHFNEHPEAAIKAGRKLTVAQAIKFVYDKPWGQFNAAAELGMMIGENGRVKSQFSGVEMEVADARILGNCFLCTEPEAREIVKVAPQPWFKFDRHMEVLRERDQQRETYKAKIEGKFAEARTPAQVTRVFVELLNKIETEPGMPTDKARKAVIYMKKGVVVTASKNRLTEVSQEFVAELRSTYTTLRDKASLSARLDTLQHEIATAEADHEDERVLKSYGWMVSMMEKQLRWLEAQRNVIQMRPAGQTEYGSPPVDQKPAGRGRDSFQWAKKLLTARGIEFDPQGEEAKIIAMAEAESRTNGVKGGGKGSKKKGEDEERRARRK